MWIFSARPCNFPDQNHRHIGRVRNPLRESDPAPKHLQPNQFCYEQGRLLEQYCEEHSETGWNIVRPFPIIGSVTQTWMNAAYPFGVYAAVQAYKGEPLGKYAVQHNLSYKARTWAFALSLYLYGAS